jgi:hypothetical protein
MSVALVMNVHDGLILAADSASTLIVGTAGPPPGTVQAAQVANVYNNANKIANLYKGQPIGCVTFGSGSIGNASISTLLKDFRQKLTTERTEVFDIQSYTVENIAGELGRFLTEECKKLPATGPKPTLGIFLAGYSTGMSLGERWSLSIDAGQAQPPLRLHRPEEVGINWGGEGGEAISRLILGFGGRLPEILKMVVAPPQAADQVLAALMPQLQAPVIFAPMPIQDAIDLAEFLVRTAIQFSRFCPGPQVVGGPIEIAAITKHEGFKWIQRKHYYGEALNKEFQLKDIP